MSNTAPHTPTPWHYDSKEGCVDSATDRIALVFPGFRHENGNFIAKAANSYEQLVAALRQIAAITKPQMCIDGSAKVGSQNATGYDFQLIARAALAAAEV
jgi:hypothetical protein